MSQEIENAFSGVRHNYQVFRISKIIVRKCIFSLIMGEVTIT